VQGSVNDDLRADGLRKGWGWNVNSLTSRAAEVVHALLDRKDDVACIQETRLKGSSCKFYGTKGQSCSGWEERRDRRV